GDGGRLARVEGAVVVDVGVDGQPSDAALARIGGSVLVEVEDHGSGQRGCVAQVVPVGVVVVAAVVALENHGGGGGGRSPRWRPAEVGVRIHQMPVDVVVKLAVVDGKAELIPLVGAGEARDFGPTVRLVEDPEAAGARVGPVVEANGWVYAVDCARRVNSRRPEARQGSIVCGVAGGILLGQAGPDRRHVPIGGAGRGAPKEE